MGIKGEWIHVGGRHYYYVNYDLWREALKMPVIKPFMDLLEKAAEIHKKKNDDYAEESNKYFNFDVQAYFIDLFKDAAPQHRAFASVAGLKIARLSQLLRRDKQPNNESIEDSFLDFFIYVGLWAAWYEEHKSDWQILAGTTYDFNEGKEDRAYKPHPMVPYHNQNGKTELWDGDTKADEFVKNDISRNYESVGRDADIDSPKTHAHLMIYKSEEAFALSNVQPLLPKICTACSFGDLPKQIRHAIEMHGAKYTIKVGTLKYPDGFLVVIEPSFLNEVNDRLGFSTSL